MMRRCEYSGRKLRASPSRATKFSTSLGLRRLLVSFDQQDISTASQYVEFHELHREHAGDCAR